MCWRKLIFEFAQEMEEQPLGTNAFGAGEGSEPLGSNVITAGGDGPAHTTRS